MWLPDACANIQIFERHLVLKCHSINQVVKSVLCLLFKVNFYELWLKQKFSNLSSTNNNATKYLKLRWVELNITYHHLGIIILTFWVQGPGSWIFFSSNVIIIVIRSVHFRFKINFFISNKSLKHVRGYQYDLWLSGENGLVLNGRLSSSCIT